MSECPAEIRDCPAGPGHPRHRHASPLANVTLPPCPEGHRDWYITFAAGEEVTYECGQCGYECDPHEHAEQGPPVKMRAHGPR